MKKNKNNSLDYAAKITGAIGVMFDSEGDSDFFIDLNELEEGNNVTDFFHALANMVPTMLYEKFTSKEVDMLDFNHIANRLCFQYGEREGE